MEWQGEPATYDAVRRIVENRAARVLSWPEEAGADTYKDDTGKTHRGCLVDMQTANVLVTVHDALSENRRASFEEMLAESSGRFLTLVNFCWKQVK